MLAAEIHHTYTLVHDDLPCMDDDDYRRGRLSVHKKFNQWIAVLTGDGMLNLAYEALSGLPAKELKQVLKLKTKLLGPKGLIEGQYLDLFGSIKSIHDILKVHTLKTARLFQFCLMTPIAFLQNNQEKETKLAIEMGNRLGISFQLMDDLLEVLENKTKGHEEEINAFLLHPQEAAKYLSINLCKLFQILEKANKLKIKELITPYFKKCYDELQNGQLDIFNGDVQTFLENHQSWPKELLIA